MAHVIRPGRPEELDALLAAYAWLFAPPGSQPAQWDPERARATLARLTDGGDATVLVAADDATVGFCSTYLDIHSVRLGRRAWVEDLAVDPARRSEGIGKGLLDAAKAWGRERGATHLELDSGDVRADAHRFYERERPSWMSRQFSWALWRCSPNVTELTAGLDHGRRGQVSRRPCRNEKRGSSRSGASASPSVTTSSSTTST